MDKSMMWKGVSLKRLEEMLIFIAKVVDDKGAVAQPLLDRIEREYTDAINAQHRGRESQRIEKLIASRSAI